MNALECSRCGRWVENVGDTAKTAICSYCVLIAVGLPEDNHVMYLQVVQLDGIL